MRPKIHPETLALIIAEYRRDALRREREARWWRAEGKPFSEVIDRVGRARTEAGTRHPHQYRLSPAVIEVCVAALHRIAPQLEAAKDYITVHFLVADAFAPIYRAGEMAIYDAADRICERLGLSSEHVVFLHRGARIGFRRLIGGRIPKESAWGVQFWQLPEGLRGLTVREAEDVLCIYKDDFLLTPSEFKAKRGARAGGCRSHPEARPTC